ncbi:integrase [Adhaeribacter arboris]|uniref:Integrase n=1 Tax=Adhaeribacter arboris TaxID=2072846 RepID=A0A2T2YKR6_9BACT|nr:site-specific integrase [Adhaeribacter arboris]PSR56098.1 integrase [Adhaeribacter arboris]
MFDYSDSGVTIAAMIDNRRANKEGLYPVKVRVTFKRERKYYSTGKWLTLTEWVRLPDAKSKKLSDLKKDIQVAFDKIKQATRDLIKDDLFTFDSLNIRLGSALGLSVNTAIKARIASMLENNQVGTVAIYKSAEVSLTVFAGNNIKFNQITPDWLRRFERYMLDKGKSYTTISMYLRSLQVIVNEAKAAGIIKANQYPFGKGKYEIPQSAGRNIALNLKEIARIVNYECKNSKQELSRDLWFFSYLCNGANMADICRFKFSNIRGNEIAFYRQKTITKTKKKKLILAIVTPQMQAIMDKWGNKSNNPDDYIFTFMKGGESAIEEKKVISNLISFMCHHLQIIGAALGISNLSTYTARHSYASVLKRSGANIAFISESLGHSDLKTTENYLASFEQEERAKNAALLTNF